MAFDLFCLALVGLFALLGMFRGLLRQIFGMIGFVGGIVLARVAAHSFGEAVAKDLKLPIGLAVAGMALGIFLAAEVLAHLIGSFLHKRMEGGFTAGVNRFGGFLVGAAKGLLVAWAVASLVAIVRPHVKHLENDTSLKKADFAQSKAIAVATEVNLVTELRQKPR